MENNNKWGFGIIVSIIIISLSVFLLGFNNNINSEPSVV